MAKISRNQITKYVLTAVFAAMVFVGTVVVQISIPATGGYVNIGDVFIILAAFTLGSVYGGIAGAVGAGLVDLMFYPTYAPATIVIKFIMGVVAAIFVTSKSTGKVKMAGVALGAFCSEIIMIVGYLLYEIAIMGAGAALAGITGNIIQGGVSIVIALVLVSILDKTRFLSIYSRRMGR